MKTVSTTKNDESEAKKLDGWDRAIKEAEDRIRGLALSIAIFKINKAKGEPFPSAS